MDNDQLRAKTEELRKRIQAQNLFDTSIVPTRLDQPSAHKQLGTAVKEQCCKYCDRLEIPCHTRCKSEKRLAHQIDCILVFLNHCDSFMTEDNPTTFINTSKSPNEISQQLLPPPWTQSSGFDDKTVNEAFATLREALELVSMVSQ